jgi:hypothetical protein
VLLRNEKETSLAGLVETPRPQSSDDGADLICASCDTECLNGHHGEVIIEGASDELVRAKWNPFPNAPNSLRLVFSHRVAPTARSIAGELTLTGIFL